MKTVKDACTLQDNALTIRVSDQIEQLDELIGDEAAGRVFFEPQKFWSSCCWRNDWDDGPRDLGNFCHFC